MAKPLRIALYLVMAGACSLGGCKRSDSVPLPQPTIPDTKPASTLPAAPTTATTLASRPADETLLTRDYVALGMPSPDHAWSAPEMQAALEALQLIAAGDPAQLPRLNSKRSGEMFTRIIATDNFERLRTSGEPLLGRMRQLDDYITLVIKISQTYIRATKHQEFAASEVVALHGAHLRMVKLALELFDNNFATLSHSQQNSSSGQLGVDRIRRNLRDITQARMDTLGDNTYVVAPRLELIDYCRETFPLFITHLLGPSQQLVTARLDELISDPALGALSPQLKVLRSELEATTKPSTSQ